MILKVYLEEFFLWIYWGWSASEEDTIIFNEWRTLNRVLDKSQFCATAFDIIFCYCSRGAIRIWSIRLSGDPSAKKVDYGLIGLSFGLNGLSNGYPINPMNVFSRIQRRGTFPNVEFLKTTSGNLLQRWIRKNNVGEGR